MKKIFYTVLAFALAVCLAGCGASQPQQGDDPGTEAAEGFRVTCNGVPISLKADATPILAALGEPKNYTEQTSCAFEGLDKTYFYGSFYLTTYPMDGKDYVYSLWFADDSVSTPEGIRIGSPQAEVERVWGAECFNGTNAYILTKGDTKLTILMDKGAVSSIQYTLVLQ